jgi:hypothetical protein
VSKRTSILLTVLTMVFLAGAGREARAAISCSECATACANACGTSGVFSCDTLACSGGVGACSWTCRDGSHGYQDCGCSTGGGSPIFKKRPVNPAPTKNSSKQTVKPMQAIKPAQAVKPEQSAKPAQPATSAPAQSEGSTGN